MEEGGGGRTLGFYLFYYLLFVVFAFVVVVVVVLSCVFPHKGCRHSYRPEQLHHSPGELLSDLGRFK